MINGRYPGSAYWERETPEQAKMARAWLSYYPQAGKLQVSIAYRDRASGEPRKGTTVTLDAEDLRQHPEALALLRRVVEECGAAGEAAGRAEQGGR